MQESVAGARTFVCRGAHVVRCTKAYKEKIIGLKNTRTTLASEHAGSDVGSKGKRLNIDAGSLSIEAPSGISFKAQRIDLDVSGALVADSLEISGGKLRPKEGIAQIEGNAQKLGGGKVGA
jgi:phage gp45-like